jgi:hypothetical protein
MFPSTRIRPLIAAMAATLAILAVTGPVAANQPIRTTRTNTFVVCESVTGSAGTIRLAAGVDDAGSSGTLQFWAAPGDPTTAAPSLVSLESTVTVGPDGTITAAFDMYLPEFGLDVPEPIFVGTAHLSITTERGVAEPVDEAEQRGNTRIVTRGVREILTIVSGSVAVPTAGSFDLTGDACAATRESLTISETDPSATIEKRELIELTCFFETATGIVFVDAQSGVTETFVSVTVIDSNGVSFGETKDPDLSIDGIQGTVALEGDPNVVGTADISADFDVSVRDKGRIATPEGWEAETVYVFAVNGTVSLELAGLSLVLPMDTCSADAQIGMGKTS